MGLRHPLESSQRVSSSNVQWKTSIILARHWQTFCHHYDLSLDGGTVCKFPPAERKVRVGTCSSCDKGIQTNKLVCFQWTFTIKVRGGSVDTSRKHVTMGRCKHAKGSRGGSRNCGWEGGVDIICNTYNLSTTPFLQISLSAGQSLGGGGYPPPGSASGLDLQRLSYFKSPT